MAINEIVGENDSVAITGTAEGARTVGVKGIQRGESGGGVQGEAEKGAGVVGLSKTWIGVHVTHRTTWSNRPRSSVIGLLAPSQAEVPKAAHPRISTVPTSATLTTMCGLGGSDLNFA